MSYTTTQSWFRGHANGVYSTRTKTLDRSLNSILSRQYGVVTIDQARAEGLSDGVITHAVRTDRLKRVLPRVLRSTAVPVTWEQKLLAAVLWAGPASWVSHASAAALWNLPGFPQGPLEVITTRAVRSRPGITLRRVTHMPSRDVQALRRIPVTNPLRTLFNLSAIVDDDTLEVALDFALHRRLASVEGLHRRLNELGGRGVVGSDRLRRLLTVRGPGEAVPESVLETRFIQLLRRRGLPLPDKQTSMTTCRGAYRVDFDFRDQQLVVEVDGGRWHSGRAAMQRDRRRDNALVVVGKRVLRFTWYDVMHDESYVDCEIRRGLGIGTLFDETTGHAELACIA